MIKKYTSGKPIATEAVTAELPSNSIADFPFENSLKDGKFTFEFKMEPNDIVYGLGEALAFVSNQREVVKLGLVILELFSRHDEDTIKNIIKLGSCDEFTFFAILALSQENNYNDFIFELANIINIVY